MTHGTPIPLDYPPREFTAVKDNKADRATWGGIPVCGEHARMHQLQTVPKWSHSRQPPCFFCED